MLLEILEARAAEPSRRVLTKEERRALLHYFTLQPPSPASSSRPPLPDKTAKSNDEGVPDPETGKCGVEQLQNGGKEEGLQGAHCHFSTTTGSVSVCNMDANEGVAIRPAAISSGRGTGDVLGGGNGERVTGVHGGSDEVGCDATLGSPSSGERFVGGGGGGGGVFDGVFCGGWV